MRSRIRGWSAVGDVIVSLTASFRLLAALVHFFFVLKLGNLSFNVGILREHIRFLEVDVVSVDCAARLIECSLIDRLVNGSEGFSGAEPSRVVRPLPCA